MSAHPTPPSTGTGRRSWQPPALQWLGATAVLLLWVLISAVLVSRDELIVGDAALHSWSTDHRPPVAQSIAAAVTATGTSVWPYVLVFAGGALTGAAWRTRLLRGGVGVAVLLAGQGIRLLLMTAIARPRPPQVDWATRASGFSMPSGHTTTAAITAGLVCWALTNSPHQTLARCIRALAVAWAVCVALTRIYLGVHWMSDILAGWLLSSAYLAFTIPALAPFACQTASPQRP